MSAAKDLINEYQIGTSIRGDDISTTQTGSSVDMQDCGPEVTLLSDHGTNPGDDTTIDIKLQESDDDSTFTDIDGATVGQISGDTENALNKIQTYKRNKRYVRAVATIDGTSVAIGHLVVILMAPKVSY